MNQPLICAGFVGFEFRHVCIFYDALMIDHAHRPSGNTGRDAAVFVYTVRLEFILVAENAVSPSFVPDAEIHVEPSLALEHVDKLLEKIPCGYFCRMTKCWITLFHLSPLAWFTLKSI